jgi:hypothetical protein
MGMVFNLYKVLIVAKLLPLWYPGNWSSGWFISKLCFPGVYPAEQSPV